MSNAVFLNQEFVMLSEDDGQAIINAIEQGMGARATDAQIMQVLVWAQSAQIAHGLIENVFDGTLVIARVDANGEPHFKAANELEFSKKVEQIVKKSPEAAEMLGRLQEQAPKKRQRKPS